MTRIHRITISPPLINSSCAWSGELEELRALYDCPWTGAVTTRTATAHGFREDASHTVAFARESTSTINSFGYSPHPLSTYLGWIESLVHVGVDSRSGKSKPFIISLTSSDPAELRAMLASVQDMRARMRDMEGDSSRVAVELNTSCPNIQGHPPSAYDMPALKPILAVLAETWAADRTLTIGLKLPPYLYSTQFSDVLRTLSAFSLPGDGREGEGGGESPFAFLTCTNTLGSSLLFSDQVLPSKPGPPSSSSFLSSSSSSDVDGTGQAGAYAVPTALGGLAGEALHALSLGNVHAFSRLLRPPHSPSSASASDRDRETNGYSYSPLRRLRIVGVGGVTSPEAAERMRRAGADVVGCATLLGKEGVTAFELLSRPHSRLEGTPSERESGRTAV